jgi:hypothetical protein
MPTTQSRYHRLGAASTETVEAEPRKVGVADGLRLLVWPRGDQDQHPRIRAAIQKKLRQLKGGRIHPMSILDH